MLTTCSLFPPDHTVGRKVIDREWEREIWQMEDVSNEVKELIALMLHQEPDNRPSAAQIIAHPWFEQDEAPGAISGGAIGRFDFDEDSDDERRG
jgi:serine/threonine protein kinase